MSEVCRFAGIIISIYYDDHGAPHFHARYGEYKAKIYIETLDKVSRNYFPHSQLVVILHWAELHKDELFAAWMSAQNGNKPQKINP